MVYSVYYLKKLRHGVIMNDFNKKDTLNDTNYTSHNNTLMLKMVTSYSIFLLIILVLFIFYTVLR